MAHLRVKAPDGPQSVDRIVPLDRDVITLGREPDNALVLASSSVSRHHARIERESGGWAIVDQGSSYGTYVQGQKVARQRLVHGDVLALGDMRVEYLEDGFPASVPPPLPGLPPPAPPPVPPAAYGAPVPPPLAPMPAPQAWPPALPSSAPPPRRSSMGLLLGLGGGLLLLLLLAIGGWLAWPHLKGRLGGGTAGSVKPEPPPPDPEAAVAEVLEGLRQGDAKKVVDGSHPAQREEFRRVFENHPDRMQRAAAVLATRKRVHVEGRFAEYEVTDNGRTYPVQFEFSAGKWLLVSM